MRFLITAFFLLFALPVGAQSYDLTAEEQAAYDAGQDAIRQKDFAEAEARFRQVVASMGERMPANHPARLSIEGDVAGVLAMQKRWDEAVALRRDVLARFREVSSVYSPLHAIAQMGLAKLLADTGARREALPLAIEAVSVAEQIHGDDDFVANVWRGELADIMADLGLHADAEALWARSLEGLDRAIAEGVPGGTNGLQLSAMSFAEKRAFSLEVLGRDEEAVAAMADALERRRAFWGDDDAGVLAMTLELAKLKMFAGDTEGMHATIAQVMPKIVAEYGDSPMLATALSYDAIWWLYQEFGSEAFHKGVEMLERADAMFEATLPKPRGEGFRHEGWGRTLLNLAAVRMDLEDWLGAMDAVLRAEKLGHASRNTLVRVLDGAGVAKAKPWREIVPDALRIAQRSGVTDAGHALEQMAARVSLGDSPAAKLHRAITDAVDREAALQAEYAALLRLPAGQRDYAREVALKADLSEVSLTQKRLTEELHKTAPDFTALINDGLAESDELRALLGPDEAIILFDIGERDGDYDFVFVITDETTYWLPMPVEPTALAAAVADLRAAVDNRLGVRAATALKGAGGPAPEFPLEAAHYLYAQTFGQIADLIEGKTHLYVELRGPLTAIPPHLMVRNEAASMEEADWLIRHHAITVVPSVFALKAMEIAAGKPRASEPILGIANPDFDPSGSAPVQASSNRGGALAPLPETFEEVRDVAGSMGAGEGAVLQQGAASEAAVKAADLERFRVLYFATHGLVSGDEVKESVVEEPALALTPGGGEDGLLTASEIALLRMNPDWVVLSACNTAVGETPDAEALSGLAQAFLYAGARALLVSHWPVESQSAVSLMTDIFARRAADPELSAAEAQRQAMLAMIDGPRAEWRHPAYWAPFILVGDPDR
ncbi:CHAT domain-containing protein [Oceanicola sp. D3]|uniref:CHAT domain-containing tetratricopeptide repeat protein n=1 Tax=Oceanicola sp. D3 TaxID=2587163 RepID=UPI0011241CA7|nr:CHAT domain-containing tetratricopeptide repeat protein [Oceanicola sp. D3]QDC09464.1 CHAT domain-containing protein [Oceanicola sp. D3]